MEPAMRGTAKGIAKANYRKIQIIAVNGNRPPGLAYARTLSDMSKPISYFIDRAKECIRLARNAPTGKQSELLRLANEWLALGHEVQDDLERPHTFN